MELIVLGYLMAVVGFILEAAGGWYWKEKPVLAIGYILLGLPLFWFGWDMARMVS